jgi:hypothetical protein
MATREPSTGDIDWYIDGSGPIRLPGDMIHVVRWKAFEPFSEPDDDAPGDLPFAARKFLRELGSTDFAVGVGRSDYELFAFRRVTDAAAFERALSPWRVRQH